MKKIEKAISNHILHFSKKDWIYVSLLTVLSAILIFFRIGSMKTPETGYEFNYEKDGQSALILDLGEEKEVSQMYVFLGNQENRRISVSTYDATADQWNIINDLTTLEAVFRWNRVDIGQRVNNLGIIELDGVGVFNELVLLDSDGNLILPVNADNYPALFDEQEKFPELRSYYDQTYFDEIYHARTAYETLHSLDIYETSHPPLGKDLMSIGIRLFGMTPFGWRFVVAVFGVLLTPLLYAFLLLLTKKTRYAVAGTILLNMDFMHLTLSRIGTIDAIVAFFIMASFFLMYGFIQKEKIYTSIDIRLHKERLIVQHQERIWLLLCGFTMGCGIATKWTGAFAALGLAVQLLGFFIHTYSNVTKRKEENRHIKLLLITCLISFIGIPLMIYLISYLPYTKVSHENLIKTAIDNTIHMFQYHENVTFVHIDSSKWYEWPWIRTPLLDVGYRMPDGRFSLIVTFGNPIIWWSGIIALFHNIYLWIRKKDQNARFLCIAYAAMFIPWIFIRRTQFIYQYYVCSILLVLLLMNSLTKIKDKKGIKVIVFVTIGVIVFAMFYPVISGYPVSKDYINHFLHWMPGWKFMNYVN